MKKLQGKQNSNNIYAVCRVYMLTVKKSGYPEYDTQLYLMATLRFRRFETIGVPLYCYYN